MFRFISRVCVAEHRLVIRLTKLIVARLFTCSPT
jgi:hypothetical protein